MGEGATSFDAVILAGGGGVRLGGVSKADLTLAGERLLDRVLRAASGAAATVVVGAVDVPAGVTLTREDPPGTGPAAGLLAGLDAVASPSPWTLVLACDLPDAPAAVARLHEALAAVPADAEGLCLRDPDGELQHLAAFFDTAALRRAFSAYGDPANRSVRGVLADLRLLPVDPGDASAEDLDTPEQLARWVASHPRAPQPDEADDRAAWRAFVEDACARLGLDAAAIDEHAVLRMARRVSHTGSRPMAPVSAFVLGLAIGAHPDADPEAFRVALEAAIETAPRPAEA